MPLTTDSQSSVFTTDLKLLIMKIAAITIGNCTSDAALVIIPSITNAPPGHVEKYYIKHDERNNARR
jgi:hypothetical protein